MIFLARQLQKKRPRPFTPLMWILDNIEYPPDFIARWKDKLTSLGFYRNPYPSTMDLGKVALLLPLLFLILIVLYMLSRIVTSMYNPRIRITGKVFDLTHLKTKSKIYQSVIRVLLYTDDAHTEKDM